MFIKNKVQSLFPNVGIRKKAMQTLCFHLALHSALSSEPSLLFGFCVDLHICLSCKCYLRESVAEVKQAVL